MKKNYEDYKTGLINEKKEDISRKIEILKKDMENKSDVALDIMKPMLQQREEKLKQINDEIANVENPEFEKEFEELENGQFGNYENVKYFGIKKKTSEKVREQVKVLYYNSKEDFAIKLLTKSNDEVIISRRKRG